MSVVGPHLRTSWDFGENQRPSQVPDLSNAFRMVPLASRNSLAFFQGENVGKNARLRICNGAEGVDLPVFLCFVFHSLEGIHFPFSKESPGNKRQAVVEKKTTQK